MKYHQNSCSSNIFVPYIAVGTCKSCTKSDVVSLVSWQCHALAAGLKAITTVRTMTGSDQCRLSCGGHGYSLASGLPQIYGAMAAPATAEGEATILLLQTARYDSKIIYS